MEVLKSRTERGTADISDQIIYKNFIINFSKNYKNKISVFNRNSSIFIGDFYNIISAKNYINKFMS
jgi:hypothetical protein